MTISGPNPNAWENWYHAVGSTYGTWIRGDQLGFRTYRHKQHVQGDYRHPPPPGVYAPLFEYCRGKLKHPPVKLSVVQRQIICRAMIERLEREGVEVIALAVCENHFHLLARFPTLSAAEQRRLSKVLLQDGRDPSPRYFLSRARREATYALKDHRQKPESRVWADRPKFDPIRDRRHKANATAYIVDHISQGAAVYDVGRGFVSLFE
jgi:REP element-mobilizing transposase RayT